MRSSHCVEKTFIPAQVPLHWPGVDSTISTNLTGNGGGGFGHRDGERMTALVIGDRRNKLCVRPVIHQPHHRPRASDRGSSGRASGAVDRSPLARFARLARGATSGTVVALVDLSHSAAKAHHGGDEQMFGAKQQVPHAGGSYKEAECNERVLPEATLGWSAVSKSAGGPFCGIGQPALMSQPTME
jgi:hypothetical protein